VSAVVIGGMHDMPRRQIAVQQPIVRRSKKEVAAQHVEPLTCACVLANDQIEV
jgi:hypothetical protein